MATASRLQSRGYFAREVGPDRKNPASAETESRADGANGHRNTASLSRAKGCRIVGCLAP